MTDETEDRKKLARGFARFVIKEGHGAMCPTPRKNGEQISWQARGREIYGKELFNQVLREELEAVSPPAASP